ncbi:MAG: Ig-like domain-containing protein [Bacteroidota bacterium]
MKRTCEYILTFGLLAGIVILAFSKCANQVTPAGGPKDTIPPEVISSKPPNYSVNFESDEVEIEFNEFIQFDELQQQFLSSPPFEEDPDIQLTGKGLKIEFNEPLRDSTTYTLNFGNAIVDFREGNPLRNFKYVFSTGPELDSMEVQGNLVGALDLRPREDMLVMLYEELNDSVPYRQIPTYVSRTNEDGSFVITNVRMDTFKIFALGDQNDNYLYNNIEEPIAFRDSLITFEKQQIEESDTIFNEEYPDTTDVPDSIRIDTVITREYEGYPTQDIYLRLFNEAPKEQYLKTSQRNKPGKVDFIFNKPVEDSIEVNLLDSTELNNWFLQEGSLLQDTITYWIKDSSIYNKRHLEFEVGYPDSDSLNNRIWSTDTIEVGYSFEDGERTAMDTVELSSNLGSQSDLNKEIRLHYPYPVDSVDTGKIELYQRVEDTLWQEKQFRSRKDTQDLNKVWLDVSWEGETNYKLRVLPQALQAIYNAYHDTLEVEFSTQAEDHYGSLIFGIKGVESDYILQLVTDSDDKERVVREKYNEDAENGTIRFDYLDPGDYRLKLIYDRNGNKKWDTGHYLQNIQPEKVIYHPETFNVRSNWEYEMDWNVNNTKVLIRKKEE